MGFHGGQRGKAPSPWLGIAIAVAILAVTVTATALAASAGGRYFGHDGAVLASGSDLQGGRVVAVDGRGRIVVAGPDDESESYRARTRVARLGPGGRLDLTFSRNGISASLPISEPAALALGGKSGVLLAGSTARTPTSAEGAALAVAHLRGNGSLDRQFGEAGIATVDAGSESERALAVRAMPGGDIRVVGEAHRGSELEAELVVAQLTSSGQLDSGFAGDGVRRVRASGLTRIDAISFDRRNRIVAAGDRIGEVPDHPGFPHPRVARFSPGGSPDTDFGAGGLAVPRALDGFNGKVTGLALDRRGRAVVTLEQKRKFVVFRLRADGALDHSFARGGVQVADLGRRPGSAEAVAVDSRGRIVAVGVVRPPGRTTFRRFAALRLHPDGTRDRSFGRGGFRELLLGGGSSFARAAATGRRGAVIAVGEGGATGGRKPELAVVRYP